MILPSAALPGFNPFAASQSSGIPSRSESIGGMPLAIVPKPLSARPVLVWLVYNPPPGPAVPTAVPVDPLPRVFTWLKTNPSSSSWGSAPASQLFRTTACAAGSGGLGEASSAVVTLDQGDANTVPVPWYQNGV